MKKQLLSTLAATAALFGVCLFGGHDASAASVTLTPGQDVQAAVDQATAGDTITFSAGTYTLPTGTFIDISSKNNISLVGTGTVFIAYDGGTSTSPSIKQAIKIVNSTNITLTNLNIRSTGSNESDAYTGSSGINIVSSCNLNLNNLNISGFNSRSGIDVSAYNGTAPAPAGCTTLTGTPRTLLMNINFNNITLANNSYGILFSLTPWGVVSTGVADTNIGGITFQGTTTISGGDYGIITNNSTNAAGLKKISGTNGGNLAFGTVNITTKTGHFVIGMKTGNLSSMAMTSRLNGKLVSTLTYKEFCDIVGKYIIPDEICDVSGVSAMEGFNCVCYEQFKTDPATLIAMLSDPDSSCAICPEGPCVDPCPDGTIPDEDGNCITPCDPNDPQSPGYPCVDEPEEPTKPVTPCPDGSMPDENGNCDTPCDPNDPNSPGYPCVPNTGFFGNGTTLDTSSIILLGSLGTATIIAATIVVRRIRRTTRIRL